MKKPKPLKRKMLESSVPGRSDPMGDQGKRIVDALAGFAESLKAGEPLEGRNWCPCCDRMTMHTIHGFVRECQVCLEPTEIEIKQEQSDGR